MIVYRIEVGSVEYGGEVGEGATGGGIKEDLSIVVRGSDNSGTQPEQFSSAFGGEPLTTVWVPEILASAHNHSRSSTQWFDH